MPETTSTEKRILFFFRIILKVIFLLISLFIFACSLDMLSNAFQLISGKLAGEIFLDHSILHNPISGSTIGLLVTAVLQSSTIATSIIITMVSSSMLKVSAAIPMLMGANVGTSITNTLVALMYAGNREEFGRAFAGATVHDFFNWFSVLVLLPLELITEFLSYLSDKIGHFIKISGEDESPGILKVLTGPITERIIQLDGKIFIDIVIGRETQNKSLIKIWCKTFENVTFSNVSVPSPENCTSPTFCWTEGKVTWTLMNITYRQNITKCKHLFVNTNYNDATVGFILLTFSLFILAISLALIIKILNSELRGPVAEMIKKYINKDFPYPFAWLTGYFTILVGAVLTFTFQSSSVFTSIITPMIGIDMISLERAYPLILGSNIGTSTITILAALSGPRNALRKSFQVTLCHFLFNLFGIILWYPIPGMRLPVHSARRLGNLTATYRWFAIVYVIFCFFVLPTLAFCFSIADTTVLISVGIPMFFLPFIVVYLHAFNLLHLLPLWMTSLKPWDDLIISIMNLCTQCGENISHKCKNSKLNRFIARRSLPTIKTDLGPDQNQRHSSIRDRLFYVKKSDDTVKEIQSTNDTVTEIQSANQQFSINDASTD